jgi:hypothetical protein
MDNVIINITESIDVVMITATESIDVVTITISQALQGEQGIKGEDSTVPGPAGYTPIKGVDYFDGYTPIKGVDYFDGEKGDKGDKGDTGEIDYSLVAAYAIAL